MITYRRARRVCLTPTFTLRVFLTPLKGGEYA